MLEDFMTSWSPLTLGPHFPLTEILKSPYAAASEFVPL